MGDVPATLRQARTSAGLSQRELARRAGSTQAMVARYEAGDASPTVATLTRLLAACGRSLELVSHDLGPALQGPVGVAVNAHRRDIVRMVRDAGATHPRVFGSVARGEDRPDSDVDLVVDFPVRERGLLPLADLGDRISGLLGVPVDVAAHDALAPEVASAVEREAVPL